MKLVDYFEGTESLGSKTDLEALLYLQRTSLFHVHGEDSSRAALVTVMLHGNEPCGFRAMLKEINEGRNYPVDLYWLVGNVKAAQMQPTEGAYFTTRVLPDGQNYNRIWTPNPTTGDEQMAQEVFDYFAEKKLVGMLDIHSFTPHDTPPHGFLGDAHQQSLQLAWKLVEHPFVIDNPMGTIAERFAPYTPSISVECGTNGTPEADNYAYDALQRFFVEIGMLPGQNNYRSQGFYYGNMINVKLRPEINVVWAEQGNPDPSADITIRSDVSKLNITEVPAGTFYAHASRLDDLFVLRQGGREIPAAQIFDFRDGALYFKNRYVPNLMSPVEKIQKESGFYLFTRINV